MKRIVILSLAVGLVWLTGCVKNFDKAKLDAYFDTLANNDKFMGSVAVSRNGELIYSKTVGFTDIENDIRADEKSKYKIASISKTFTTVLTFIAIEENKLNLHQTIDKFFPEIRNAHKITILHLLYHRSGIADDNSLTDHANQPETEQETLERIVNAGTDFEPDTKAVYGNMNFVLLTFILEKIYQKPFHEILEEKITKPAGLKNTYCVYQKNENNIGCKSYKYSWQIADGTYIDGWESEDEIDLSILSGAVGIISNAVDLALFGDALFNGELISNHSLQQMKTIKENYGMGLMPIPFNKETGFGHPGNIDGFNSIFVHFPDSKISFALTANGLNFSRNNIAHTVLSAVKGLSFDIPEFTTYTYHVTNDLDNYQGTYSSEQIPVKVTVIQINNILFAAKETSFVPLKATEKDKFVFEEEGIVLEFNQIDKTMVYKQGSDIFKFIRTSNPEFNANIYELTDEELDKYLGTYSSGQISIRITVVKACKKLFVHATRRNSVMLLEGTEKDKFEFSEEGIIFEFNPNDKTLVVKQGGRILNFASEH
jgi:CubicO group peptidase (beta-lactamase class C family)